MYIYIYNDTYVYVFIIYIYIYIYMYCLFFPVGLDRLLLRKTTQMPLRDDLFRIHQREHQPW